MIKKPQLKQAPEAIVLGLVAGLLAIYLLAEWRWEKTIPELIYTASAIGLLSVLSKNVAFWIATGWMGLGQLMGKVVGSVLLSIVFIFILTPLARLQSVFSKSDKFKSGNQDSTKSAWVERKHQFSNKDLEELW